MYDMILTHLTHLNSVAVQIMYNIIGVKILYGTSAVKIQYDMIVRNISIIMCTILLTHLNKSCSFDLGIAPYLHVRYVKHTSTCINQAHSPIKTS